MTRPTRAKRPVDPALLADLAATNPTPDTAEESLADQGGGPAPAERRQRRSALESLAAENQRPRGGRPTLPVEEARTERLNVYVTKAQAARYKTAYQAMPYRDRPESFSIFCDQAIEQRVSELEAQNNGGERY